MLHETVIWDKFVLDDDLLESATRWASILEPHKHVKVEGHRQMFCYGEPQYLEPLGSPRNFELSADHYLESNFLVTEKVDGRNMALIFIFRDGKDRDPLTFVRSRTEIIGCLSDFCVQDEQQFFTEIVDSNWLYYATLAQNLASEWQPLTASIVVLYGEYYGPRIQKKGKLYGEQKKFRFFGAKVLPTTYFQVLAETPREEHNRRRWMHVIPQQHFFDIARSCGLPTVPVLGEVQGKMVDTPDKIKQFLGGITESIVAMEDEGDPKEAFEGVVLRADCPLRQWKLKKRDYGLFIK
jgi:hypothetical protein